MAKVLLVNPPFYRLLGSHYNANSLGIAYIASYLNKHGHEAWLYNADYVSDKNYGNLKKLFQNFTNYKSYFKNSDNALWHEIKDKILLFEPEWVGYTAYTANIGEKETLKIEDNTIVYFVDDVFTIHKKRVKKLLRMMIDQKLKMRWKCEARADHLDDEICELMAQAGCERVKIGFESGSDRILSQVKKLETKEEMLKGASMLKNAGVPFSAYFMAGFPGETDDDVKKTIIFAKELEADFYSISVLAPYFGTKMYYDLMENGFELDKKPWEYFFHQTSELMVNSNISKEVLEEYLSLNELNDSGKGYI